MNGTHSLSHAKWNCKYHVVRNSFCRNGKEPLPYRRYKRSSG